MAASIEFSMGACDWETLMQDNGWEFDDLVDTSLDFEGLDGWLAQDLGHEASANDGGDVFGEWHPQEYGAQTGANDGANANRDQSQILSPPLYAGFEDRLVVGGDELEQPRADGKNLVAGTRPSIQSLEREIKQMTRTLDNLYKYVEELQPWTQAVGRLVTQLLVKQSGATTINVDHTVSDQQAPFSTSAKGVFRSTPQKSGK